MGPEIIVEEEVQVHIMPPPIVGGLNVLSCFLDPVEGILGDLDNPSQHFYKQKQREKLPQMLKGSVHNLTTRYVLYCHSGDWGPIQVRIYSEYVLTRLNFSMHYPCQFIL